VAVHSTGRIPWYGTLSPSGPDATGVTVAKDTFNSSGQFTVIAPYLDFKYGLPLGSLVSSWQASTTYASGQYISYALNSTQAPDWATNHTYAAGDVILPLTNNPLGCGLRYPLREYLQTAQRTNQPGARWRKGHARPHRTGRSPKVRAVVLPLSGATLAGHRCLAFNLSAQRGLLDRLIHLVPLRILTCWPLTPTMV